MQTPDISEFNNTSGWHVEHDPNSQMYLIRSDKGHKLQSVFTHRRFAEIVLREYLVKIQNKKRIVKE